MKIIKQNIRLIYRQGKNTKIIALFLVFSLNTFLLQANKIDSLFFNLQNTEDSSKLIVLEKVTEELTKLDPQEALRYGQKALEIAIKNNYKYKAADLYIKLGDIYQKLENYKSCLFNYNAALNKYVNTFEFKQTAYITFNMGKAYSRLNDYNKAMECYIKSLNISEQTEDIENIGACYNGIALIHHNFSNYDKAILFHQKALNIAIKTEKKKDIIRSLNNIANAYKKMEEKYPDKYKGHYFKALEYYTRALKLAEELKDKAAISSILNNLGTLSEAMGNFEKALEYQYNALKLRKEVGNKRGLALTLFNIGSIYKEMKQYTTAIDYIKQSEKIAIELMDKERLADVYLYLSDIYFLTENYQLAYDFQNKNIAQNQEIYNRQTQNQLGEMLAKYELEKQEREIVLLNKEKELKNATLLHKNEQTRIQKILTIIMIAGLCILSLFLFVLNFLFSKRRKINKQLQLKKEEILEQKEEIAAQANLLSITNKELEKLSIVASKTDNIVIIADAQGEIEWVNESFEKTYGYNLAEFKKLFGSNLIKTSSNSQINDYIQNAIREKHSAEYLSESNSKIGKKLWFQTTLTPILDIDDNIIKIVTIDSDISKIKEAEQAIIKQNEEINAQNTNLKFLINELENQKQEIKMHKELIEDKNKFITDSINYAQLIQESILPSHSLLEFAFPDSFILYKPKDIVSGDFFWFDKAGDELYFAVVDCTGHGVPGAFMSIVGFNLLNQALFEYKFTQPSEILNFLTIELRNKFRSALNTKINLRDGMELSLCCLNTETNVLKFAGAFSSLYLIRNNELIIIKGDSQAIEIAPQAEPKPYTNHELKLNKNDCLYLFSDGFVDQTGGPKSKKFQTAMLKETLLKIHGLPMKEQKLKLEYIFENWKGNHKQRDDVTILGLRIS